MVTASSLPGLLTTLTESLNSAVSSFPASSDSLLPPADGISLLDTKNDLLLSYLQNIAFFIILKLRSGTDDGKSESGAQIAGNEAVKKLVEIRIYLEKGVRPLEGRLKYQIEKVLRAADDAERSAAQSGMADLKGKSGKTTNGTKGSDTSDSDSDSAGSEGTTSTSEEAQPNIDDLSYRPNPAALLLRNPDSSSASTSNARGISSSSSGGGATYKPPRITPTSMPDLSSSNHTTTSRSDRDRRKRHHSHLLDEYISTELSSTPHAEPSIGSNSTILRRGRGALSARDRDKERERTEYEERNFSRLPGESRKERLKRNKGGRGGEGSRDEFGGEDWTGLGGVGDRVGRSMGREKGNGGKEGKGGILERREKRRREGGEFGAGGAGIGDSFEKKRKIVEGRAARKRKAE